MATMDQENQILIDDLQTQIFTLRSEKRNSENVSSTQLQDLLLEKDSLENDVQELQKENLLLKSEIERLHMVEGVNGSKPEMTAPIEKNGSDGDTFEKNQVWSSASGNAMSLLEKENQIVELNERLSEMDSQIRLLQQEKSELLVTMDTLRASMESTANERDAFRNVLVSKEQEVALLVQSTGPGMDHIRQENVSLRNQVENLVSDNERLKRELENLSTDLMSKEMEIEDLQEQQASDSADRESSDQLSKEIALVREEAEKLHAENENLRVQTEKLESLSDEKESLLTDLTGKITALSKEKEDLSLQIQQMMKHEEHKATSDSSELESLRQQLDDLSAKYQEAETQRKKSSMHLAALGKSLKKAEDDAATLRHETKCLRDTIDKLQVERDEAISDRGIAYDRLRASELEFTSKIDELQAQLEVAPRDDEELHRFEQKCKLLEQEVQRYRELEEFASSQLEESERLAREQNQSHERLFAELNSECDDLRLQVAKQQESIGVLRKELSTHASNEASSLRTECMELRASVARLQQAERSALEVASTYESECLELRQEVIGLQKSIADLEKKTQEQAALFGSQIEALQRYFDADQGHANSVGAVKAVIDYNALSIDGFAAILNAEFDRLKEVVASRKRLTEELERTQADLQEVVQERDAIRAENEEILIQFGYLKQQIDEAEEYTKSLEEEISRHRQKHGSEMESSMEALSASASDLVNEMRAISQERDALAKRVAILEKSGRLLSASADSCSNSEVETDVEEPEKLGQLEIMRDTLTSMVSQEMVQELEAKIQYLSSELESVRCQLQVAESSLAAEEKNDSFGLFNENRGMNSQFHGNNSEFVQNSDYITKLELDLQEKQMMIDDLQKQIQSASEGNREGKKLSGDNEPAKSVTIEEGLAAASQDELVDSLRSYVVSLALALERSEIYRAETINRLVAERETHALSLRRMSENMKRFYASMSYGDV
jgi:chromosome segregation ATPase